MKLNRSAAACKMKKRTLRGPEKWIMPQLAYHEKPIRKTRIMLPK